MDDVKVDQAAGHLKHLKMDERVACFHSMHPSSYSFRKSKKSLIVDFLN